MTPKILVLSFILFQLCFKKLIFITVYKDRSPRSPRPPRPGANTLKRGGFTRIPAPAVKPIANKPLSIFWRRQAAVHRGRISPLHLAKPHPPSTTPSPLHHPSGGCWSVHPRGTQPLGTGYAAICAHTVGGVDNLSLSRTTQ